MSDRIIPIRSTETIRTEKQKTTGVRQHGEQTREEVSARDTTPGDLLVGQFEYHGPQGKNETLCEFSRV